MVPQFFQNTSAELFSVCGHLCSVCGSQKVVKGESSGDDILFLAFAQELDVTVKFGFLLVVIVEFPFNRSRQIIKIS